MSYDWKKTILQECRFEYTRSRGAGGQHVNRTDSAAILRFCLYDSYSLSDDQKLLIGTKLQNKLTNEGEILLREESSREREMNRKLVMKRFLELIEKSLHVPKIRKKTKPTYSSKQKRLSSKKMHSDKKKGRTGNWND